MIQKVSVKTIEASYVIIRMVNCIATIIYSSSPSKGPTGLYEFKFKVKVMYYLISDR